MPSALYSEVALCLHAFTPELGGTAWVAISTSGAPDILIVCQAAAQSSEISDACRADADSAASVASGTDNIQKLLGDVNTAEDWNTVDKKKERKTKGLLMQPDRQLSEWESVPESWHDDASFSRFTSPALFSQPNAHQAKDHAQSVQQAAWDGDSRKVAWDDGADLAVSLTEAGRQCEKCGTTGHNSEECPKQTCEYCQQPGHHVTRCQDRQQQASQEQLAPYANHRCRICRKKGHLQYDCPEMLAWEEQQFQRQVHGQPVSDNGWDQPPQPGSSRAALPDGSVEPTAISIAARQFSPETLQQQPSDMLASSTGSDWWEGCQGSTDADSISQPSTGRTSLTRHTEPASRQHTASVSLPQERFTSLRSESRAPYSSPVAAPPSALAPGMPRPPLGSPPHTAAPQLQSTVCVIRNASPQVAQISNHTARQPADARQQPRPPMHAPEWQQAKVSQQQKGLSPPAVHPPEWQQPQPRQQQQGPFELQEKQQAELVPPLQMPSKQVMRVPGWQKAEPTQQQQQDGWDDSTIDPPFSPAPPQPLPFPHTPKSSRSKRAYALRHPHSTDTPWTPPEPPRAQQHPAGYPVPANRPTSGTHTPQIHQEASAAGLARGHSALPQGVIQPGMGPAPPSTLSTTPAGMCPGQRPPATSLPITNLKGPPPHFQHPLPYVGSSQQSLQSNPVVPQPASRTPWPQLPSVGCNPAAPLAAFAKAELQHSAPGLDVPPNDSSRFAQEHSVRHNSRPAQHLLPPAAATRAQLPGEEKNDQRSSVSSGN